MPIRVLIVDDHALTREGIRLVLSAEAGIEVTGEARDGATALASARELLPDALVLDVAMPGIDGTDVTRKLKEEMPGIRIVALSGSDDRVAIKGMLDAGADAYVLKGEEPSEIVSALREVMKGGNFFSRNVLKNVVLDYTGRLPKEQHLTDKEKGIVRMISDGFNTKEIASEFGLSVKSIEVYRSQIMQKLGLKSIAELVKYAIREGLSEI
jgi:DNA-binding NarL/FixJ family response regulator